MGANAADWTLAFESCSRGTGSPCVTIAIPTFNRPGLIRESLASAAEQRGYDDYEILIVDNASDPDNVAEVRRFLEIYKGPPLRYVVNHRNLGMFGNWNRCLELARGEWVTILSDDDLLRPVFLSVMMKEISRRDPAGALICRTAPLDQRVERPAGSTAFKTTIKAGISGLLRYRGRYRIRLTLRRLFWGNIAGSSLGCLYRRRTVLDLGGFNGADFPSADFALHLRLAGLGALHQIRTILADVRLQVNESIKPTTLVGFVTQNYRYRRDLLDKGSVPRRWERWLPSLLAYESGAARRSWGATPSHADITRQIGQPVPAGRASWIWILRALHGGV